MKAIRVGVLGAGGRMGRRVTAAAIEAGLRVGAAVDRPGSPDLGKDAGLLAGIGAVGAPVESDLAKVISRCDVVIDFTAPAATAAHAALCADHHVPMVIGTTGVEGDAKAAIAKAAKVVPVVHAANFSIGVNALLAVVTQLAQTLSGYDVEVVEIHHRKKVDAPSGTAIRLAEAVAAGRKAELAKIAKHGRAGQVGARTDAELGMHAVRGGDVIGDHTVYFLGAGERIEVTHRASSRDTFAAGAVRAASWVVSQKPGLYEMKDVLGL
ncbi:MAG TPA: 4-hydroxy-tetrahydrodipicolinate reductase [bacterium]|nr:4-hydroxy-tetrahydrodipicolinate reductase [bacterium]